MTIILHGGPANDETHGGVAGTCGVFTRYAAGPDARYRASGRTDVAGRHFFKFWPLEPGVEEQADGVQAA